MTETLRQAVDASIDEAVKRGAVDTAISAAPIAMLRAMADLIDGGANSATPAFRYVTPASFLSYCDALNLIPPKEFKSGEQKGGALNQFMKRSRYAKIAEGYAKSNDELNASA